MLSVLFHMCHVLFTRRLNGPFFLKLPATCFCPFWLNAKALPPYSTFGKALYIQNMICSSVSAAVASSGNLPQRD